MRCIKPSLLSIGLLLFLIVTCAAQQKSTDYGRWWKKVDSLINQKGLPKTALTEVNAIYARAGLEKNEAQRIKALVYRVGLNEATQEETNAQSIARFEKETVSAGSPSKEILLSLLAEQYHNYFQQKRWQLYNRTQTVHFKNDDINTWSAADLHKKTAELYLASIKNTALLQQTRLDTYDAIIEKGNVRYLRPTLYDLLAFRALEYFSNDERDITKPAYAFEINDARYFDPAPAFTRLKITSPDSLSLYEKALLIYQQLLVFHANDPQPDALIDADIHRVAFVHDHGTMENKDTLYEKALLLIATRYENRPVAAQALYLVASLHADRAGLYSPEKFDEQDPHNPRYEYLTAAATCKKILAQKDMSEGKANAIDLLADIQRRELQLTSEKVNVPGQPFRALVAYRNMTVLHLRLLAVNDAINQQLEKRNGDAYWTTLKQLSPLRSWEQALPATGDYQQHSVEIKIDALPSGEYMLLASADSTFKPDKNPLAAQYTSVSNISFISNMGDYFVLDRQTGKPLVHARVQPSWSEYDNTTRSNKKVTGVAVMADSNGFVHFMRDNTVTRYAMTLDIRFNNDRLQLIDNLYFPVYRDENAGDGQLTAAQYEKKNARVFFFTDRGIYRPGQTIYFKGIALIKDKDGGKNRIISGRATRVVLSNANNVAIDSLSVTTNEYGSYSGKFRLPESGINGRFYIRDTSFGDAADFSVEEYKRPLFYVDYEKITGSYKVNDSITVTGLAKAYAGNAIDGAQVKYRVQRTARFIYPWLYWRIGYPQSNDMEITNGVLTTRADGSFAIRFKAIPDASVNKAFDPVFDYSVTADVTDINGETRSNVTNISVSYKALRLHIEDPAGESMPADSLRSLRISTQNMSGSFEPAMVNITISRLQPPTRLIRDRYWQQPDQYSMSREAFLQDFPLDDYNNETDHRNWPKTAIVWQSTDSSHPEKPFNITPSLAEGWYVIEAGTKDKYGDSVKDIKYVSLFDEKSNTLPSPAYEWDLQKHATAEPGSQSSILLGSSAANLFVIQQADRQKGTAPSATYQFFTLSNEKKTLDFPVTENDRGGFSVAHFFVKDNRFYYSSNKVMVPWSNKDLDVAIQSFRDKTLPGSEEKWKLKISGYKKEAVAAELLAGMYDASLDQFVSFAWNKPYIWPLNNDGRKWNGKTCFAETVSDNKQEYDNDSLVYTKQYDALDPRGTKHIDAATPRHMKIPRAVFDMNPDIRFNEGQEMFVHARVLPGRIMAKADVVSYLSDVKPIAADNSGTPTLQPQIRKNFNETAFFFPDLQTDSAGDISFGFTMPEALTKWKFQALAHTKDLAFGYTSTNVVTQKPLMVQPNAPRFLREGDRMDLSAKVVNMSDKELTGTVQLELLNAATNEPADGWFRNMYPVQYFTAEAGQSTVVKFSIDVPYQYNSALVYRFVAKAGDNSDGEEAALPVLSNSILVTESMPLPVRGSGAKNFKFEKLLQSGNSETLQQHALTVEFTSNPAWYAVQALPYLIDYPYECAEQTFNRYYANALASMIAGSSPKLRAIFDKWNTADTAALLSNLQKNEALKSALLEETPWVMEAKTEAQQKKNLALLFDLVRMNAALSASFEKLKQLQSSNGGFVWFKGGPDDRYITQYILSGIGHLQKLHALSTAQQDNWSDVIKAAISYADQRIKEDYDYLVKHKVKLDQNNLGNTQIQYLYLRSMFNEYDIPGASFTAINYYRKQSRQYWLQQSRYMQGMIALSLFRTGDVQTAKDIVKSLKENAVVNEEQGMYWKDNIAGYYWQQAPIETQSLLIEAFNEISKDNKAVDDLKTWLLKQKQVQNWGTTKATAEACYALLLQGGNWLGNTPEVTIKLGDKSVSSIEQQEAGTGYFKKRFEGPFVHPSMGDISVRVAATPGATPSQSSWGAVYWQYFEQMDKITPAATPLKLSKKLFVERNTDKGPVLDPVGDNAFLKVGDKIKVRIELRVDRDMEYVHMKDMRASCMEPVNVLSGYKWQDGLGYYESTRDASTGFFFSRLPKGTYVFEYPLFVTHAGNFSNGITTIQCMYAPEFTSHSEGVRINVE